MSFYETSATSSNSYNRDARLRAIAMNAVREAVIAFNRIDQPYTDSDAATFENVYVQLTAIGEETNVFRQNEHQSLTVEGNAPSATQRKIAEILESSNVLGGQESKPAEKTQANAAKA